MENNQGVDFRSWSSGYEGLGPRILRSGEFDFHFYQKIGIIFRRPLLTCGPAIRDIASYSLKLPHLKMKVGPVLTRFLWHDV
ncbi:MAG TPA: hypothetical protein VE971_04545, partial [Candidatus Eisenbacteria bacterium]|nr:hypothetical protein [Candidatus Eisenbacteria bacterium]